MVRGMVWFEWKGFSQLSKAKDPLTKGLQPRNPRAAAERQISCFNRNFTLKRSFSSPYTACSKTTQKVNVFP